MYRFITTVVLACFLATTAWSQQAEKPSTKPPVEAAKAAADKAAQPSAEEVLEGLLRKRTENPLIEPARPAVTTPLVPGKPTPAPAAIAGSAPGASSKAPLRREGQFVITRRGRMVRGSGGATNWMFVFDSDGEKLSDPPMYLTPCLLLEDMENIAARQGDSAVFVLSGQVFVYRGANYLLPTLMKLAPVRGNLQP